MTVSLVSVIRVRPFRPVADRCKALFQRLPVYAMVLFRIACFDGLHSVFAKTTRHLGFTLIVWHFDLLS